MIFTAKTVTYPEKNERFFLKSLFKKKLVCIAHPLASDPPGNIEKAKKICCEIAVQHPDVIPICPLLTFSFFQDPKDRDRSFLYCLALLEQCDELWLAGNWQNSLGCLREKKHAEELGMVVQEWVG